VTALLFAKTREAERPRLGAAHHDTHTRARFCSLFFTTKSHHATAKLITTNIPKQINLFKTKAVLLQSRFFQLRSPSKPQSALPPLALSALGWVIRFVQLGVGLY
jgi:hypothetical protein